MNKKLLELFEEHINFPEDCTEICWYADDYQVIYNTDNKLEDLIEQNGNTYSGLIKGQAVELGGYVMYTLDSECGWDYQAIFTLALKVDYEE